MMLWESIGQIWSWAQKKLQSSFDIIFIISKENGYFSLLVIIFLFKTILKLNIFGSYSFSLENFPDSLFFLYIQI